MDYTAAIRRAVSYIHRRYQESVTVREIAEQAYLSPSYFSTVFRALTGYTAKEYLLRYRLYRTALELRGGNERIIAVSFANGFGSQQALTKSFTQVYGIAPTRFRREKPWITPFPPENLFQERRDSMELKEMFEQVRYFHKDAFYVIGIETDINYNQPNGTESIRGLYDRWNGDNLLERVTGSGAGWAYLWNDP